LCPLEIYRLAGVLQVTAVLTNPLSLREMVRVRVRGEVTG
jgi:hypothetical protein